MIPLANIKSQTKIYESANSLVYRGINKLDNTPVILKFLKEDYPTKVELTRYKQEYKITRSLNLNGVIKAYSQQEYQRTLVIILEDFGGESLQKLMQESVGKYKPMPLREFLCLAVKITEILGNIHSANVIHKDINPGNIVINSKTEEVKIIDFGISTRLPRSNPTLKNPDVLEGTLAYISPEQTGRMNRSVDYRTDFYSLGATYYQLLTSELPFETTDVMELVHCHIAKQPLPPSEVNPEIPQAVSDIVMKLLAKNAQERYQSAWGIKADLEQCLAQLQRCGTISEFPLASKDISDKFQIPQKLYGREVEVETLLSAFEQITTSGAGEAKDTGGEEKTISQSKIQMMLIAGYSGIGKSALVQEIYKPITQKRGYFISGKFDQFQRNIPYLAVVNAFQGLVKQLLSEQEDRLQQWQEKLSATLGTNGQVIIDVIPEVELIIGKQAPVPDLGATESKNRFSRVFQDFIRVFCSKEHPLVIFLDDLQWVDSATLKLIELMLCDSEAQYLFLIGAYRDNEVNPTHPLVITLEELKKQGANINQITLTPLDSEALTQLVAETLHSNTAPVKPLAELVLRKTGGNPFFVNEFLKTLYTEKLIEFDKKQGSWQWNLEQIRLADFTDNVVELMALKIQKLSGDLQQMLQIAAAIGNQFDLQILAISSKKSQKETALLLHEAIAEGLVLPLGDAYKQIELDVPSAADGLTIEYKFVHDRIQQAAYSLISVKERQAVHWQVGQVLLRTIEQQMQESKIFEIVNQLNLGIELINHQSKRDELADLNLRAGKKAKDTTAYEPAFRYLKVGIGLLRKNSWQTQYELTLWLYVEAAEVACLFGDSEQLERLAEVVLKQARTLLDKVKIYEVKLLYCMQKKRLQETVKTALPVLKLLGVSFPKSPSKLNIILGFLKTHLGLVGRRIENLSNLPQMTDPYKIAAIRILSRIGSVAFFAAPSLYPLIVFKGVNLSVRYGNAPGSVLLYAGYGAILSGVVGDINSAYKFGQLSLNLLEQLNFKQYKSQTIHTVNTCITHWKKHIRETIKSSLDLYQNGLETGDLEFASYAVAAYGMNSYFVGKELSVLEQEMTIYRDIIRQTKYEGSLMVSDLYQQVVLNLMDLTENPCCLIGKLYNKEKLLPLFIQDNNRIHIYFLYLQQAFLFYLFENYQEAVENAVGAEEHLDGVIGMAVVPILYFYDSLARLAVYPSTQKSAQKNLLKKVTSNQKKMKKWAHHAPMNYLHKYYLVEAEKARVLKKVLEAEEFYEQAIQNAGDNRYIQEEALAYEIAAKFYLARGREKFAQTYMKEAHYCYTRWGAIAKVKDLEAKYPHLLTQPPTATHTTNTPTKNPITTTSNRSGETLDLATVMKASQAIAGEILLDKLLDSLMKILIENAGAQKGFLILDKDREWLIEASGEVDSSAEEDNNTTKVSQSIPINNYLPVSIINYVVRTHESVVLNDATREGNFTNEPYIKEHRTKSILCAPLVNQGKLVGIVYLENNLTTGAFTQERLQVLNLLSSQAAISIENAKLYSEVKESEKELSANEHRLKQFLEAIPVGIGVVDATGRPYYSNQRAIELMGKGVVEEATSEEIAEVYQLYIAGTNRKYPTEELSLIRALRGEQTTSDNVEIHQDDKIIPVETWGTPIYDENDNVDYGLVAFQDITERKQAEKILAEYNQTLENQVAERTLELEQEIAERKKAEQAAQDANKAKSTFLANMSHELRNPLNAILGFSQLMSRSSDLPPEYQKKLSIINRNGEHLKNLIDEVLDLSKIEAGRTTLNTTSFDIHRLLNDLENMFLLKADNKGLQLTFDINPSIPQYVHTDEVKLRKALINLLYNAIKFTQQGSISVRVSLDKKQQTNENGLLTINFEVEDTGCGIASEELDSIFENFVQAKAGQQLLEGTGLGLPIARFCVELMGGEINFESQLGHGTTFKFYIQVSAVESVDIKSKQASRQVIALEPNQPSYRILLVDDNLENRQLLRELLSPLDFELQEASNGQEAIEIWDTWKPQLIWMDIRMPVMDGIEATKQIKATTEGQNTAIIALTASVLEEKQAIVLSAGCDDFIRKPFRDADIFEAMHKHIGVRYIYDKPTDVPTSAETKADVLTPADFALLPPDLVDNLRQAICNLDLEMIQSSIAQIGKQDESLASAIAILANNFQYKQLLKLTQPNADKK